MFWLKAELAEGRSQGVVISLSIYNNHWSHISELYLPKSTRNLKDNYIVLLLLFHLFMQKSSGTISHVTTNMYHYKPSLEFGISALSWDSRRCRQALIIIFIITQSHYWRSWPLWVPTKRRLILLWCHCTVLVKPIGIQGQYVYNVIQYHII